MHRHLNVKCYNQRAILHKPTYVNYNQATEWRTIDVEDGISAGFPCSVSILSWHVPTIPKHLSLAKFIVWLSLRTFL